MTDGALFDGPTLTKSPDPRRGPGNRPCHADSCYANAYIESCFGAIKTELEMKCYDHALAARREIGEYIRYYTTRRCHSALDYLTPEEFEAIANE